MEPCKSKNVRVPISERVRASLWVAAGGRCEFCGCNKPLDKNILTQQKVFLGQHAHIIGDSADGPRGDPELSKKLAHDPANLMLLCQPCHTTIDRLEKDYGVEALRRMKKRHEDRIQFLYDIVPTQRSVPVVFRHPIKHTHVPEFSDQAVQAAILKNSDFLHAPREHSISLDFRNRSTREDDPRYWAETVRQMKDEFSSQLNHVSHDERPEHFSVFAFAPMPLNMQLGILIGNKAEAAIYQWDRVHETWQQPSPRTFEPQTIQTEIPTDLAEEVALIFSLSAEVSTSAVKAAIGNMPIIRCGVANPTPMLVEDQNDLRHFRTQITALMAQIRNHGVRRVHVFPAMPLSMAVEFGRQILPKADPTITVWDYQDASRFVQTMDLVV